MWTRCGPGGPGPAFCHNRATDKDKAGALWDRLATAPHFHAIYTRTNTNQLFYTEDAHGYEYVLTYVTDLIEGEGEEQLSAVWIAEAMGIGCPLLHGDPDSKSYAEGEAAGADEFLSDAMTQKPFWMAAQGKEVPPKLEPDVMRKPLIVKMDGDEEYSLELDGSMVFIKFRPPTGMDIQFPPGQLEKWQRIAYRDDKTVDEVVNAAIAVAFRELGEGAK